MKKGRQGVEAACKRARENHRLQNMNIRRRQHVYLIQKHAFIHIKHRVYI